MQGEEIKQLDNSQNTVNIVNRNIEVMTSTNAETQLSQLSLQESAAPSVRYSSKLAALDLTLPNVPVR